VQCFVFSNITAHGVDSGYEKRQQNTGQFPQAFKWRVNGAYTTAWGFLNETIISCSPRDLDGLELKQSSKAEVVPQLLRVTGFEPTFCSGGNAATRKLLIRWNHWDHFSTSPDCLSEKLPGKLLG
jgi:hypothetical protein